MYINNSYLIYNFIISNYLHNILINFLQIKFKIQLYLSMKILCKWYLKYLIIKKKKNNNRNNNFEHLIM